MAVKGWRVSRLDWDEKALVDLAKAVVDTRNAREAVDTVYSLASGNGGRVEGFLYTQENADGEPYIRLLAVRVGSDGIGMISSGLPGPSVVHVFPERMLYTSPTMYEAQNLLPVGRSVNGDGDALGALLSVAGLRLDSAARPRPLDGRVKTAPIYPEVDEYVGTDEWGAHSAVKGGGGIDRIRRAHIEQGGITEELANELMNMWVSAVDETGRRAFVEVPGDTEIIFACMCHDGLHTKGFIVGAYGEPVREWTGKSLWSDEDVAIWIVRGFVHVFARSPITFKAVTAGMAFTLEPDYAGISEAEPRYGIIRDNTPDIPYLPKEAEDVVRDLARLLIKEVETEQGLPARSGPCKLAVDQDGRAQGLAIAVLASLIYGRSIHGLGRILGEE